MSEIESYNRPFETLRNTDVERLRCLNCNASKLRGSGGTAKVSR